MRRLKFPKLVIGLVGGIGSGKTRVATILASFGCAVIDADQIGHELLVRPVVKREIRRRLGAAAFDEAGNVSRPGLARIVFGRPRELQKLNEILHPRIHRRVVRDIARARKDPAVKAIVLDAAVLFEAGWDGLCTCRLFVDSRAATRASRVVTKRGWTRASWRLRELSQISLDKKRSKCEYNIDNSFSASRLREQVRRFFLRVSETANCPT